MSCQLLNTGENCHSQAPERSVFTSPPVKCKFQLRCGSIYVRTSGDQANNLEHHLVRTPFHKATGARLIVRPWILLCFPPSSGENSKALTWSFFSCGGHSDPWERGSPGVSLFIQVIPPFFFYICCMQMGFYCRWCGPVLLSSCTI